MDLPLALLILAAAVRLGAALLFALSAVHKLRMGAEFESVVAAYRVLPSGLVEPFALMLPWLELAAAASLLWPAAAVTAVAPAIALLAIMTAAIGINLLRGRSSIDCGCGGTKGQGLSFGLVVRNALLALLLVVAARPLTELDTAALLLSAAAAIVLLGFFHAASQLLVNARRWRQMTGGQHA